MIQIYSRFAIYCIIFTGLFFTSCKDEVHPIPNVPVNLTINLDLPSYQALNGPGGYAFANGGSRGLFIYRNFDEFIALDRHSTFNHEDPCSTVILDPDNELQLIDTCSGATYSVSTGVVIAGPAKWGLKRYNTSWDGQYSVYVFN